MLFIVYHDDINFPNVENNISNIGIDLRNDTVHRPYKPSSIIARARGEKAGNAHSKLSKRFCECVRGRLSLWARNKTQ
jgi:hypothetical protein